MFMSLPEESRQALFERTLKTATFPTIYLYK